MRLVETWNLKREGRGRLGQGLLQLSSTASKIYVVRLVGGRLVACSMLAQL